MLQRLGIADALVKDPDVLILGADDRDRPARRRRDPRPAAAARPRARHGDPPLEPPPQPGPVGLRPDRHLRLRPLIGQGTLSQLAERVGESKAHVEVAFETTARPTRDDRRGPRGHQRRRVGEARPPPDRPVDARRRRVPTRPTSSATSRSPSRSGFSSSRSGRSSRRSRTSIDTRSPGPRRPRRSPVTAPATPIESAPVEPAARTTRRSVACRLDGDRPQGVRRPHPVGPLLRAAPAAGRGRGRAALSRPT